jgi:hypothetical protein
LCIVGIVKGFGGHDVVFPLVSGIMEHIEPLWKLLGLHEA